MYNLRIGGYNLISFVMVLFNFGMTLLRGLELDYLKKYIFSGFISRDIHCLFLPTKIRLGQNIENTLSSIVQ